ncbi:GGDEF domain-containing protein [Hydrogenimonas sp.]
MNNVANRSRYKILGGLLGGLFLTSAAAWLPMLIKLLEAQEFTPESAQILAYAIFFLIAAAVSYLFVAELIKTRIQKRRCDEILNTSAVFELHDKQLFHTMGKKQVVLAKRNGWSVSMVALFIQPVKKQKRGIDISSQIKEIAINELEKITRCSDLIGSFAKNEYLVFLQNCNAQDAKKIAERFKKRLSDRYVTVEDNVYKLECKCGIAALEPSSAELKRLMELAYDAMDRAVEKHGSVIETH